jgi:hypothetical protein
VKPPGVHPQKHHRPALTVVHHLEGVGTKVPGPRVQLKRRRLMPRHALACHCHHQPRDLQTTPRALSSAAHRPGLGRSSGDGKKATMESRRGSTPRPLSDAPQMAGRSSPRVQPLRSADSTACTRRGHRGD